MVFGRRAVRGIGAGAFIGIAALIACGDDDPTTEPPVAAEVSIYPESITLTTLGENRRVFAAVSDQHGEAYTGTISWSSSSPGVFTVNDNGTVTAVANGSGTLTASFQNLSASASVTVNDNRPPTPRGEIPPLPLSVGGGVLVVQPTAFFEDPNDEVADLTFTTSMGDPTIAGAAQVADQNGVVALLVGGISVGATEMTIVATDPGGLSAEQVVKVTVDDEGYTAVPGVVASYNRLDVAGVLVDADDDTSLAIEGRCSPPLRGFVTVVGYIMTINGSAWQSRADAESEWANIEETLNTEGQLCSYGPKYPGEYRVVFSLTGQVDATSDPITGNYRSENTFTVVDTVTVPNRAPVVTDDAYPYLALAIGAGAPIPVVASRYFVDPDGDPLTFSVSNSDTATVSAESYEDGSGELVAIMKGVAVGMSSVTVTATDPEGLSADWTFTVLVDDSGATAWPAVYVANGMLIAFGSELTVCMPPVVDFLSIDGSTYTVHQSKWQTRSDSTAAWADVAGTERTDARVCPHTATEAGDYRVIYEMSILAVAHAPVARGWVRSPNHFTVSSGGDRR